MVSPYKDVKVIAKYANTPKGFNDTAIVGTIKMTTAGELRPFPVSFFVAGKVYVTKETQAEIDKGKSALYVGFAVSCLCRIDKAIEELSKEANTNLFNAISQLQTERESLIKELPAFRKTEEILTNIKDIEAGVK